LLGRDAASDAASAAARVRAAHGTRHLVVAALLGYADAVLAGRQGRTADAEAAFAAADRQMGPLMAWYRQYARRLAAEAALADGWGEPVGLAARSRRVLRRAGDDQVAAACRALLRRAGAPVAAPGRRPGTCQSRCARWALTEREADVLRLAARASATGRSRSGCSCHRAPWRSTWRACSPRRACAGASWLGYSARLDG